MACDIAYATSGAGPPLVKPANWMTHLEYDWESPVWRHWLRELSREHTLIRYDERGSRTLGPRRRRPLVRSVGARPRDGRRRAGARAVPAPRHLAGLRGRDHLRRAPSRARLSARALRRATRRASSRGRARREELDEVTAGDAQHPAWLGTRQPRVPHLLRGEIPPRRHARADALVQRAAARHHDARDRLAAALDRGDDRRHRARPAGASADARAARDRRRRRGVQSGAQARVAHPAAPASFPSRARTTSCSRPSRRGRASSKRCAASSKRPRRRRPATHTAIDITAATISATAQTTFTLIHARRRMRSPTFSYTTTASAAVTAR